MPKEFFEKAKELAESLTEKGDYFNSNKSEVGKKSVSVAINSIPDKNILSVSYEDKIFLINYEVKKIFYQNEEVKVAKTYEEIKYLVEQAYIKEKTTKAAEWRETDFQIKRELGIGGLEQERQRDGQRSKNWIVRELRELRDAMQESDDRRDGGASAAVENGLQEDWEVVVASVLEASGIEGEIKPSKSPSRAGVGSSSSRDGDEFEIV